MPKQVLLEEFHLGVFVSAAGDESVNAVLKTLRSAGFRARLRQATKHCFREFPSLAETRIRISR